MNLSFLKFFQICIVVLNHLSPSIHTITCTVTNDDVTNVPKSSSAMLTTLFKSTIYEYCFSFQQYYKIHATKSITFLSRFT